MRKIVTETFYCEKLDKTVTVVEYIRHPYGGGRVCGILSCSHQDGCVVEKEGRGVLYPWGECPACIARTRQG